MDSVERMARSALFEGMAFANIEALCLRGEQLSFEIGQLLFERGQEARGLMILEEGLVDLFIPIQIIGVTREVTIETKQIGEVVAWSALVEPHRFTLGARAASDCVLSSLSRETLEEFFKDRPQVGHLFMRNLARVIGSRLQSMQTMWLRDLQLSATRRMES